MPIFSAHTLNCIVFKVFFEVECSIFKKLYLNIKCIKLLTGVN